MHHYGAIGELALVNLPNSAAIHRYANLRWLTLTVSAV